MLLESEKEETRIQSADLYLKLTDLELAFVEVLKKKPELKRKEYRNPMARMTRHGR